MTDPREMTDLELNAAVASLLDMPLRPPCPDHHRTDDVEYDSEWGWCGWCYECAREVSEVPEEPRRYATDPGASREMEEKIGKRAATAIYARELARVVFGSPPAQLRPEGTWSLIHATPRQRAEAAVMAARALAEGGAP